MDYNSNTFQNFPAPDITATSTSTLTNKTMDYNSNTFQNFPSGDVTASSADTFTNKTISGSDNTFSNIPYCGRDGLNELVRESQHSQQLDWEP